MADLLNVVTLQRFEETGAGQNISNSFAYFQREDANVKSVYRVFGIVSNPDMLFSGFLCHPIVCRIY